MARQGSGAGAEIGGSIDHIRRNRLRRGGDDADGERQHDYGLHQHDPGEVWPRPSRMNNPPRPMASTIPGIIQGRQHQDLDGAPAAKVPPARA